MRSTTLPPKTRRRPHRAGASRMSPRRGLRPRRRDARERFGRLDILVNNAGRGMKYVSENFLTEPTRFWETDPAAWRLVIDTNVIGPFLMARAAVPAMLRAGWGRIVNISMTPRPCGAAAFRLTARRRRRWNSRPYLVAGPRRHRRHRQRVVAGRRDADRHDPRRAFPTHAIDIARSRDHRAAFVVSREHRNPTASPDGVSSPPTGATTIRRPRPPPRAGRSNGLRHCERSETIRVAAADSGLLRRCAPRNDA